MAAGLICTSTVSMIIASLITLLFSKMISVIQKRKKNAVNNSVEMTQRIKEPIYDDIELTDKISNIDFSKNVAYAYTRN